MFYFPAFCVCTNLRDSGVGRSAAERSEWNSECCIHLMLDGRVVRVCFPFWLAEMIIMMGLLLLLLLTALDISLLVLSVQE